MELRATALFKKFLLDIFDIMFPLFTMILSYISNICDKL
ncbi:hypothetical protein Saut_0083 [Sulfurimonas autotrophica DSM 16294]|uniref:Uncharacterized protein n=1 Tax=Sulfurimonas autotrophica (strain ATCC BAA-671 / DSM 16294 / JCM 11897 / OK10) TaxID=563040 RepID=E0USV5_SULAO|nr:hypothetical protein Saut_0083 [Sulfurimonas autotrophica DSM 16294]